MSSSTALSTTDLNRSTKKRVVKLKRASKKSKEKGRDIFYYFVDIYLTDKKEEMIKREVYRYAREIAIMHPDAFRSTNEVSMFVKRHHVKKTGFSKQTPPKRRRMTIYKKVIGPQIIQTAFHLYGGKPN